MQATTTPDPSILDAVRRYYTAKLEAHGATAAGVDWNSVESQRLRFDVLLGAADPSPGTTLLDYGCGYGALLDRIEERDLDVGYVGFDLSNEMIDRARARHAGNPHARFTTDPAGLAPTDTVVASGLFNVKLDVDPAAWEAYVLGHLDRFTALARKGFAFNMLTSDSDPERMREDLYYADPAVIFHACKRRAPHVALRHDYGLYEFTVSAFKEPRTP